MTAILVVADRHGDGTNPLLSAPPDVIHPAGVDEIGYGSSPAGNATLVEARRSLSASAAAAT